MPSCLTGKLTPVRGSFTSCARAGTASMASPATRTIGATVTSFIRSSSGADVAERAQPFALLRAEVDGRRPGAAAAGCLPALQRHTPHRIRRRGRRANAAALAGNVGQLGPFLPAHACALAIGPSAGRPPRATPAPEKAMTAVV